MLPRALFSEDERYRYVLTRVWTGTRDARRLCAFIGLNPSTADAEKDDPTVRRCIGYARSWGFDGLIMLNLFALRSTDPRALYSEPDPIGTENDARIVEWTDAAERIVVAWGNHGAYMNRGEHVLGMLGRARLETFGLTLAGEPKHPLYLKRDAALERIAA